MAFCRRTACLKGGEVRRHQIKRGRRRAAAARGFEGAGEGRLSDGDRPIPPLTVTIARLTRSIPSSSSSVAWCGSLLSSPATPSQPPPSQRTTDVCLSFSPLIPLVTPSLSPDRSLGLGPRLCLHHQMLIGYRGWVWEPENELLTDNSPRCTLHQKKEIEGEGEAKWDTGRMPCSRPRSGVLH